MRVHLDRASCIGSGQCTLAAPDVFAQDDNGISYLLPEAKGEEKVPVVREAANGCPMQAIRVTD